HGLVLDIFDVRTALANGAYLLFVEVYPSYIEARMGEFNGERQTHVPQSNNSDIGRPALDLAGQGISIINSSSWHCSYYSPTTLKRSHTHYSRGVGVRQPDDWVLEFRVGVG